MMAIHIFVRMLLLNRREKKGQVFMKQKKNRFGFVMTTVLITVCLFASCGTEPQKQAEEEMTDPIEPGISVEMPQEIDSISLESAFRRRESIRHFANQSIAQEKIVTLISAVHGEGADVMSSATRPVASAGATHPIEIYIVTGDVEGLTAGVYQYDFSADVFITVTEGDIREKMAQAALGQSFMANAPATMVIAAEYQRTTHRYGERGRRFVYMESGGAAQHIALQAAAFDLGNVIVGAFDDERVQQLLQISESPLLLIPVGYRAE